MFYFISLLFFNLFLIFFRFDLFRSVVLLSKNNTKLCKLQYFVIIFFIFFYLFSITFEVNNHFISVLQYFVLTWGKMEVQG